MELKAVCDERRKAALYWPGLSQALHPAPSPWWPRAPPSPPPPPPPPQRRPGRGRRGGHEPGPAAGAPGGPAPRRGRGAGPPGARGVGRARGLPQVRAPRRLPEGCCERCPLVWRARGRGLGGEGHHRGRGTSRDGVDDEGSGAFGSQMRLI